MSDPEILFFNQHTDIITEHNLQPFQDKVTFDAAWLAITHKSDNDDLLVWQLFRKYCSKHPIYAEHDVCGIAFRVASSSDKIKSNVSLLFKYDGNYVCVNIELHDAGMLTYKAYAPSAEKYGNLLTILKLAT